MLECWEAWLILSQKGLLVLGGHLVVYIQFSFPFANKPPRTWPKEPGRKKSMSPLASLEGCFPLNQNFEGRGWRQLSTQCTQREAHQGPTSSTHISLDRGGG